MEGQLMQLSNGPSTSTTLRLEQRKSFLLSCHLVDGNGYPIDLTGCEARFTIARMERYGDPVIEVEVDGEFTSPGVIQFPVQAAQLDLLSIRNYEWTFVLLSG